MSANYKPRQRCENCRFYAPYAVDNYKSGAGECRRFPLFVPVGALVGHTADRCVCRTEEMDWCGEWKKP